VKVGDKEARQGHLYILEFWRAGFLGNIKKRFFLIYLR